MLIIKCLWIKRTNPVLMLASKFVGFLLENPLTWILLEFYSLDFIFGKWLIKVYLSNSMSQDLNGGETELGLQAVSAEEICLLQAGQNLWTRVWFTEFNFLFGLAATPGGQCACIPVLTSLSLRSSRLTISLGFFSPRDFQYNSLWDWCLTTGKWERWSTSPLASILPSLSKLGWLMGFSRTHTYLL